MYRKFVDLELVQLATVIIWLYGNILVKLLNNLYWTDFNVIVSTKKVMIIIRIHFNL